MSYKIWFEEHAKKHKIIMDKLKDLSDDEIIKYFRYDNMVQQESNFCPLYKDNTKCHDMDDLNCYLCGCSNFRLTNEKSYCDINSKYGLTIKDKNGFIHQDCSACTIPHKESFIKKNFNRNWKIMMAKVI